MENVPPDRSFLYLWTGIGWPRRRGGARRGNTAVRILFPEAPPSGRRWFIESPPGVLVWPGARPTTSVFDWRVAQCYTCSGGDITVWCGQGHDVTASIGTAECNCDVRVTCVGGFFVDECDVQAAVAGYYAIRGQVDFIGVGREMHGHQLTVTTQIECLDCITQRSYGETVRRIPKHDILHRRRRSRTVQVAARVKINPRRAVI